MRALHVLVLLSGCSSSSSAVPTDGHHAGSGSDTDPDGGGSGGSHEPNAKAAKISHAGTTVFALTTDGAVRVWGGAQGSGIPGNAFSIDVPTTIPGLESGVVDISASSTTCVAMSSGGVKCWGDNTNGSIGDGTQNDSATPVDVVGLTGATKVAVGGTFACALVGQGVKCWGSNAYHQLGLGAPDADTDAPDHSYTPVAVPGLTGVVSITAGEDHACAILTTGHAVCWGDNALGQLGIGTQALLQPSAASDALIQVAGITNAAQIVGGGNWTTLRTTAGALKSFGDDADGVLGNGDANENEQHAPVDVVGMQSTVTDASYECSVKAGEVWCWSDAGTEYGGSSATPVKIPGITDAAQVDGGASACAITTTAGIKCWGDDGVGQAGDGMHNDSDMAPVAVISFP